MVLLNFQAEYASKVQGGIAAIAMSWALLHAVSLLLFPTDMVLLPCFLAAGCSMWLPIRCIACHLDDILIRPGDEVNSSQDCWCLEGTAILFPVARIGMPSQRTILQSLTAGLLFGISRGPWSAGA